MLINNKEFKDEKEFAREGRRGCATKNFRQSTIDKIEAETHRIASYEGNWVIPINFVHVVQNGKTISQEQRDAQIEILNNTFRSANIQFKQSLVTNIYEDKFKNLEPNSRLEQELKRRFGKNPDNFLNFYTSSLRSGLLGWATFPFDKQRRKFMDGVIMWSETLPMGSGHPYNKGMTASHEVGHWLGLYHTFQGGCNGVGDDICDTVAHAKPNYGKPEPNRRYNACSPNEFDPVHNIMNYVDDDWMKELTQMQIERVKRNMKTYRNSFSV